MMVFEAARSRVYRLIACSAYMISLGSSAAGQAITVADLEGAIIEAEIVRAQTVRRDGRTIDLRIRQSWRITVDVDNVVSLKTRTTSYGPRRTREEQQSGTYTLDEPQHIKSRGGGEAAWTFADQTLTFVRTYPSGARRVTFVFARVSNGLTCAASFAFARQEGGAPVRVKSLSGHEQTIVRAQQVSSNCKVTQKI
jgi:hypothetical protein